MGNALKKHLLLHVMKVAAVWVGKTGLQNDYGQILLL